MHRGSRPISYQAIASSNLGQKTYLDNNKTGLRSGRCYYLDSLLDVVVFAQLQLLLLPRDGGIWSTIRSLGLSQGVPLAGIPLKVEHVALAYCL